MDLVLLLLLSWVCMIRGVEEMHPTPGIVKLTSSLVPNTDQASWASPSGRFAFGFYSEGGGFMVGIWLDGGGKTDNKVVWTANRDHPPFTSNTKLILNETGLLLLNIESGEKKVVVAAANASAASASMLDSGNFVLRDHDDNIIWESFMYPTDTILGCQSLNSGRQLISSLSEHNHSTGKFHLKMQEDGNLVLYPLNVGDYPGNAYWSSKTNDGKKYFLYLNSTTGFLQIINETNSSVIKTLKGRYFFPDQNFYDNNDGNGGNNSTVYSARLDVHGNLRLYAHLFEPTGGGFRSLAISSALENSCKIKGFCGFNSYCTFNDFQPYCICLPGTDFVDPHQSFLGCKRNYSEAYCEGGMANKRYYSITSMEHITLTSGKFYSEEKISKDECSRTCLEDCNCEAALFEKGFCKKQKLPLMFLKRDNDQSSRLSSQNQVFSSILFLKMGVRSLEAAENQTTPQPTSINRKEPVLQILLLTFSLIACSCFFLTVAGIFIYKFRVLRYKRLLENGNWGLTDELTLIIFSYNELRRATNGFKEELGKGSFGAVYKGTLHKGRKMIAVKRLEKLIEDGEREFQAEMKAIGRTHHRNLVQLLGYCAEDSKRLLVYEYMGNGSLASLLFKATFNRPDWNERVRIALDVAKGILYLHEECETPIIHCDIKPQNILMDDSWTAKISDFGLAKLLMGDQTRTYTEARGTRGYMAPEWHKNTPISLKVDVYSYGIVLLEIAFCRKNMDANVSIPEEVVLSDWVYKCFSENELNKLVLREEVDKESLQKMVMVALWCIQDEPALRPPMKSVVMMLEGIIDIAIPPSPTAS